MNSEIEADNEQSGAIPQRAVSIYGQGDAMDDFPVLKAFQQYIDAEQEKSRKRILTIVVSFIVVLAIVIGVFLAMLKNINSRNQLLSDRLVEYAMKESDRRASEKQLPPVQAHDDAAMKNVAEALKLLQEQVSEARKQSDKVAETAKAKSDDEAEKKMAAERKRIELEKSAIDKEKKKLSEERERLRQIEIDRQRRRLYPELYGEKESVKSPSGKSSTSPSRTKRTLTDEDIKEILDEASKIYDSNESESSATTKRKKSSNDQQDSVADEDESDSEEDSDAIEYFKEDRFEIPVDYKGRQVKMSLPVE